MHMHLLPRQRSQRRVPAGLLIATIYRRINLAVGARVRHHGLTPRQFWVLVRVYEHMGLSLRELAEQSRMGQTTASRVISTLAKRKLVRIDEYARDRRRARLVLTTSGYALAKELRVLAVELRRALEAGFSGTEREVLRSFLTKILANIDRFQRKRGAGRVSSPSSQTGNLS